MQWKDFVVRCNNHRGSGWNPAAGRGGYGATRIHDAVSNPRTTPTRIVADDTAQELQIRWADGREVDYSYEGLRRACPCATCRGGHGRPVEPIDPVIWELPGLQHHTLGEIRPSGNYAIQLVWGDGHATGIWSWTYLRSLREDASGA